MFLKLCFACFPLSWLKFNDLGLGFRLSVSKHVWLIIQNMKNNVFFIVTICVFFCLFVLAI